MKFLVNVTPRRQQLPPLAVVDAAMAWINGKVADKTFDFCYAYVTGGGVGVMNADSVEALQQSLLSYPAYPFMDFKVEPLCNIHTALTAVKEMIQRAGVG